MCYSVIIPMTFDRLNGDHWHEMARYFSSKGVKIFLSINGPEGKFEVPDIFEEVPHLYVLDGGPHRNPYSARNLAIRSIIRYYEEYPDDEEGFFLTDEDCLPTEGLHESIKEWGKDDLVAGRVTTKVPDIDTPHFRHMKGLEVYDGFKQPYETYGACMFIGRSVWNTLGSMKEDSVSGGDFDYAYKWMDLGLPVYTAPTMHVQKVVYGMDLLGIMRKQLIRGNSRTGGLENLAETIASTGDILRDVVLEMRSDITLLNNYHTFLDKIFQAFFNLGRISRCLDSSETLHAYSSSNQEQPPGSC